MRYYIKILLILLVGFLDFYRVSAQEILVKEYHVEDGLPSDIVYEVFQDSDKFIWFSTELGVSRFDGKYFKNYDFDENLPDNVIFEIKETGDKKKWFLTANGKTSFLNKSDKIELDTVLDLHSFLSELIETKTGLIVVSSFGDGLKIKTRNSIKHLKISDGLLDNQISYVWEKNNELYLISSQGICKVNQQGDLKIINVFDKNINFSRVCIINNDGEVVFTARDHIYFFSKDNELKEIQNSEQLINGAINQICLVKSNTLAACTNNGVVFFKLIDDAIVVVKKLLEDFPITNIIVDHEDNYWVSTLGKGVIMFQENILKKIGPELKAFCFFKDEDTSLYVGYDNYSFAKITQTNFELVELARKNNFSNQKIRQIIKDNDKLWFLMDGGLASFDERTTLFYRSQSGAVLFDGGDVLIGGNSGYYKITKQFLLDSLLINDVKADGAILNSKKRLNIQTNSIKKHNQLILLGTNNGLYIDSEKDGLYQVKHNVLSKAKIKDIYIQQDDIIISTFGFGVYAINKNDTICFNEKNGMLSNFCQTSYLHNNTLYVGNNKGLTIINDYKSDLPKFNSLTSQDGLDNSNVQDIFVQGKEIFLATFSGVYSFNQDHLTPLAYKLPLIIEETTVNNRLVDIKLNSRFSYNENNFEFKVTPISYKHSDRVRNFYKLTENWKEFDGHVLSFNKMNPGNYKLQIKSIINKKSSNIFTYKFTINPPYWKTWWFIGIIIFSLAVFVYLFFKIRVLSYNRDVVRELILLFINKLKKEEFIVLKNVKDGSQTKVIFNNILYVKASSNYVELFLNTNEKLLSRITMKEIFTLLNQSKKVKFIRCHKSYIVSQLQVKAVHSDFIKIKDEKIPIGKQYRSNLTEIGDLLN